MCSISDEFIIESIDALFQMYVDIFQNNLVTTCFLNPGRSFQFVDEEGIYFYRSEIRKALKLDFHK